MDDMPDFENLSEVRLRWYIEQFPSPHRFFGAAMAALEKKEAEAKLQGANSPAIHIQNSSVANLNLGSQVGEIAAHAIGPTAAGFNEYLRQMFRVADLEWSLLNKPGKRVPPPDGLQTGGRVTSRIGDTLRQMSKRGRFTAITRRNREAGRNERLPYG